MPQPGWITQSALPIAGGRIIGFIHFPRVLVLCEMLSVLSRIWTHIAMSISYDDNYYTTDTSKTPRAPQRTTIKEDLRPDLKSFDRTLAWWLECLPKAWETWVHSLVKSYQRLKKWYLMPPCFTLNIIRYGSRVKWSNPGKRVAPSPTTWCSSYQKGSLQVTLDSGHQLYFLLNYFDYAI